MSDPRIFLALYAVVAAGAFLFGLRFYRMERPPEGVSLDQAHRFGRLAMMASLALLIIPVAAWLHGDLKLGQGS